MVQKFIKQVNCPLTPDMLRGLREAAEKQECTMSSIMRAALSRYLYPPQLKPDQVGYYVVDVRKLQEIVWDYIPDLVCIHEFNWYNYEKYVMDQVGPTVFGETEDTIAQLVAARNSGEVKRLMPETVMSYLVGKYALPRGNYIIDCSQRER